MNLSTKTKWVVSWYWNGRMRFEEFESRMLAELKMIQMESWGMKPTLHQK